MGMGNGGLTLGRIVLLLQSARAIQGAFAAAGRAEERKKVR
jgi:hypothetical protein